jgi:hypothetical protein
VILPGLDMEKCGLKAAFYTYTLGAYIYRVKYTNATA